MAKRRVVHVTPDPMGWKVKMEGNVSFCVFPNKTMALAWAKDLAKASLPSQVKVHGKDGKIQTEYTYKNDPERYKG